MKKLFLAAALAITAFNTNAAVMSGPFKDVATCAAYASIAGYDSRIISEQKWAAYGKSFTLYTKLGRNEQGERLVNAYTSEFTNQVIAAMNEVQKMKGSQEEVALKLWNKNGCAALIQ